MTEQEREEREHNLAVVKATLEDLRYAMIEGYGADKVIAVARSTGGYLLFHTETLERTGEQLTVKLSIEITK